jgi:hypothetical protein
MKQYSVKEIEKYIATLESPKTPVWKLVEPIGNKQAWVVRDVANGVVALQSYWTIVSVKMGDGSVDLGKWSPTTGSHQSAFRRWCGNHPND